MIERARANARASAAPVRFETGGFGELTAALDDFAACLRPGGLLLKPQF